MEEQRMPETNVFTAVAEALWARGEDGEVIARELAHTLVAVIKQGISSDSLEDVKAEFDRLLS